MMNKPPVIITVKRQRTESDPNDGSYSPGGSGKKLKLTPVDGKDSSMSPRKRMLSSKDTVAIYHCVLCYYQTPYRYNLKVYTKWCKPSKTKKLWECPKCDLRAPLDLLVKNNVKADDDSVDKHVFLCPVCSIDSDEDSKVTILERVHPSNKCIVCPLCPIKVRGINQLKKHLGVQHDVAIMYRCEYCPYISSDLESLRDHKDLHKGEQEMGLIQCSHCHLEFFTISEFKEHMKKVTWEKQRKEKQTLEERKHEEAEMDVKASDDAEICIVDTGKWQLKCTLCQYVNYSKADCERHVKNKHRPVGYPVVNFDKYYEDKHMGSITIGKVKHEKDNKNEKQSTEELLKILDWTQSDDEDKPEKNVSERADANEVITIQMVSDNEEDVEEKKKQTEKNDEEASLSDSSDKGKTYICSQCAYQAKSQFHLSIHLQLIHEQFAVNHVFVCPVKSCEYANPGKFKLRSHLKRCHKMQLDTFYLKDLRCPDCVYVAKMPHHLLIHRTYAHKGHSGKKQGVSESKKISNKELLKESVEKIDEEEEMEENDVKFSNLHCKFCGVEQKGMYKLAWHLFKRHSFKAELRKWRLKCKVCSFESYSKLECFKHGMRHKDSHVKYKKYYDGKLKGAIGFRYKQVNSPKSKVETRKQPLKVKPEIDDNERDPTKIQDVSHNQPELKFKDKLDKVKSEDDNDIEAEHLEQKSTDISDVEFNEEDDSLLEKKGEFFECTQCEYETQNESYLRFHDKLVHGDPIGTKNDTYHCKECVFQSKYRHSLKRHLEKIHNFNTKVFYTNDQVRVSNRSTRSYKIDKGKVLVETLEKFCCHRCTRKFDDKYLLHWHVFKAHRNKSKIMKWSLRCKLCDYESYSKKYAQCHAASQHSNPTKPVNVIFYKHYGKEYDGIISFQIGKRKTYKCTKCDYKSASWDAFKHHYKRHNRRNVIDSEVDGEFGKIDVEDKEIIKNEIDYVEEVEQDEVIRIEVESGDDDSSQGSRRSKRRRTNVRKRKTLKSEKDKDSKQDQEEPEPSWPGRRSSRKTAVRYVDTSEEEEYEPNKDGTKSNKAELPPDVIPVTNSCMVPGCQYKSSEKVLLKNHCLGVHKYRKEELDPIFVKLFQFECALCRFKAGYRKDILVHMGTQHPMKEGYHLVCPNCKGTYKDRYQYACHRFKIHRDSTDLSKWNLHCPLCSYKNKYIKYASRHAMIKHTSTTEPTEIKFKQYFEDKFQGFYTCNFDVRTLCRCSKCEFVTNTWESLSKHYQRHKNPNFVPKHLISVNKAKKAARKRARQRASQPEETTKITEIKTESYSQQQIRDIIGLENSEIIETDDAVDACNNNETQDIVDESEEEHAEELSKIVEDNEVITIEITPDENTDAKNKDDISSSTSLNPFTGELIMTASDEEQFATDGTSSVETSPTNTKSFKCCKVGCKYLSDNLKDVTDHIRSCTQTPSPKLLAVRSFTCQLCKEVLTTKNSMQKHCNMHARAMENDNLVVTFSEHRRDTFSCYIEVEATSESEVKSKDTVGKVSYKCWMCGMVIVTKGSLKNHTNIHAREDENYNLKVRFSKFIDEKLEGTIILRADRNFVPRKKKPARSPEPDFNASLPVFSCDECNFKSNDREALKKHKNLHWTPQKEALYKAQKWFTCSICFFHCFDVNTFKEHSEWHKTHFNPGGIKKTGKNSWFIK